MTISHTVVSTEQRITARERDVLSAAREPRLSGSPDDHD